MLSLHLFVHLVSGGPRRSWVRSVTGDEAATVELITASEELTWRMDENGQLARTAVQLAELSTHARREELIAAPCRRHTRELLVSACPK